MRGARSVTYSAQCPACRDGFDMTREDVLTGHNPSCAGCGAAMTVYSVTAGPASAGDRSAPPTVAPLRPGEAEG